MRYTITIDGTEHEVELSRTRGGGYVARAKTSDGTRELEVQVLGDAPTLAVSIGGKVVELVPISAGSAGARGSTQIATAADGRAKQRQRLASAGSSAFELKAPMPGRIVKVLVTPGQAVSAGSAALVMEAMKMENELACPRDGTVQRVLVQSGTAVERGAVLLVIE